MCETTQCSGGSVAGALLPLAFAPTAVRDDTPVLDVLVTCAFPRSTALGFRFYPHDAPYTSSLSSSVTFVLAAALLPGDVLRVQASEAPLTRMYLYRRHIGGPGAPTAWERIATAATRPVILDNASVFLYCAPCVSSVVGIAALGVTTTVDEVDVPPVLPPVCAVPCKYAFAVPAPVNLVTQFVLYIAGNDGETLARAGIPAAWKSAWQLLRWNVAASWQNEALIENYTSLVDAAEAALYVACVPGQLTVLGYKPYDYEAAPAFPAQLALVLTRPVPAGTTVFIRAGEWAPPVYPAPAHSVANWLWYCDAPLPAGAVLDFTGLAPGVVASVSVGVVAAGSAVLPAATSFSAFTVFSTSEKAGVAEDTRWYAVTGVYTCAYAGPVPPELQPGVSILSRPWPDGGALLSVPTCPRRVTSWAVEQLVLNNACTRTWLCSGLPSFYSVCTPCDTGSCGCVCACACASCSNACMGGAGSACRR